MDRPFFPRKPWGWLVLLLPLAILWAIFTPVFSYSGPGISHLRVAREMSQQYREFHHWPKNQSEHALSRIPSNKTYSYELTGDRGHSAIYRITVDGKTELWRSNEKNNPRRLGTL